MELHEQKFELMIHEARKGGSGAREMPFRNQLCTYEVSDDTPSSVDKLRPWGYYVRCPLVGFPCWKSSV